MLFKPSYKEVSYSIYEVLTSILYLLQVSLVNQFFKRETKVKCQNMTEVNEIPVDM